MTFIAFHAQEDRADIATDTWSYTTTASHLGRASKVAPLPDIAAAVVTQGMVTFGEEVDRFALDHARHRSRDIDELNARIEQELPGLWTRLEQDQAERNAHSGSHVQLRDSIAFTIGYSPRARRFTATAFASSQGFEPVDLTGIVVVLPSPTSARPSDIELGQLRSELEHLTKADELLDMWAGRPHVEPPSTTEDWIALAEQCRQERSMIPVTTGLKVLIGGELCRTRLTRTDMTHEQVHTFDDSPATLSQVLAGTLHPIAQAGPCHCGSDQPAVECCLPAAADTPCLCASGRPFGDCCSMATPDTKASAGLEALTALPGRRPTVLQSALSRR